VLFVVCYVLNPLPLEKYNNGYQLCERLP